VARDGRDEATARKRLAAQMPLGDKIARADHVIDNAGSVAATERQADRVLDAICAHFAVPSERYPVPA
jgi:dephospho-CoA kinase